MIIFYILVQFSLILTEEFDRFFENNEFSETFLKQSVSEISYNKRNRRSSLTDNLENKNGDKVQKVKTGSHSKKKKLEVLFADSLLKNWQPDCRSKRVCRFGVCKDKCITEGGYRGRPLERFCKKYQDLFCKRNCYNGECEFTCKDFKSLEDCRT